ncbi:MULTISPECIES: hypothetical protein [Planktothricoides]|nr:MULTISPECIES: hypothetical protein [Planktothricoides]
MLRHYNASSGRSIPALGLIFLPINYQPECFAPTAPIALRPDSLT